jgi:type II secretory pathway pseudopilin PulG
LQANTPGLQQTALKVWQPNAGASTLRRYVSVYEPVRREYRKLLSKPSVVTDWDSMMDTVQHSAAFREWARVEAADIRLAFQEGDDARAVDNLRTTLLLAEMIRNDAPFTRYLVGEAMIAIASHTFARDFAKLSPTECDRVVQVVREWEQKRVPFWQALVGEKRFTIAVYHAMYEGDERMAGLLGTPSGAGAPRYAGRIMNLRAATREAVRMYDKAIAEAQKPLLQRQSPGAPGHPLNQGLMAPVFGRSADKSAVSAARLRLLACAAAVRAYRMRHGSYPRTLAEAGVADLNRDPITGGEFVYRPGAKGFLLYSRGVDGQDDGGKRVEETRIFEAKGDISLILYSVPNATAATPPGAEVWLR